MANSFTQSSLQKSLEKVPEDIKDWFGSEKITNEIVKLNDKLGLKDEKRRILPRILLRLETKDLHPADLIDEIAEKLNIGSKSANMIAEEVKEEILNPIEPSLDEWGVNIELIEPTVSRSKEKELGKKQKVSEEKEFKEKPKKKEIPIKKEPLSQIDTGEEQVTESKPEEKEKQTESKKKKLKISKEEKPKPEPTPKEQPEEDSQPFMIHQEAGSSGPKPEQEMKDKQPKRKRSFSFSSDGFFQSQDEDSKKEAPRAQIGTPGEQKEKPKKKKGVFGIGKEKEEERVVHYSDNRTDLSEDGSNKFINLSNLEPSQQRNLKSKPKNKNKQQNQKPPQNQTPNKNKKESTNSKDSGGFSIGNVNGGDDNVTKKDYKDNKNDDQDGPHVDGNTVDLSK